MTATAFPLAAFRPYSTSHAAVVTVFCVLTACACFVRRRARDAQGARNVDRALVVFGLIVWVLVQSFEFTPGRFKIAKSLPVQVCDLAGLVAPLALWTNQRWLRAILYYWGIGLSSQAFIQPDLEAGARWLAFASFFTAHGVIVGFAIYDLVARGFRPTWRDYGIGALSLTLYIATILPFDLLTGFNYAYVGKAKPDQPTIVDLLGPWPQRVILMAALVAAVLAMITLPWTLGRRRERQSAAATRGAS